MLLAALLLFATPPAMPPESAFSPLAERDGVSVEIARAPGPHPWIHASAQLDAPCARVSPILTDFDHWRAIFEPFYEKADVLEHLDGGGVRLHAVWHYPWPFRNRDAVVIYTVDREAGGSVVVHGTDGTRDGDPSDGVRIHDVDVRMAAISSSAGGCAFTYDYYGDLGGSFGKSQNEKAWRGEAPMIVNAIRRALRTGAAAPSGGTATPASR